MDLSIHRLIDAFLTPSSVLVRRLVIASLLSNIGIVLTGGAVRLTGSGLGCPTWPKCTDESFVPHDELGIYGVIEFGNRLLTYVLTAVAVATWLAVWRRRPLHRPARRLATVLALGIPFQGVIGGITVLTDLNPWVVSLHLMLSMSLIAGSTVLLRWVTEPQGSTAPTVAPGPRTVIRAAYAVLLVALYLGTVVTGSGPHAGDAESPRNDLDPSVWAHVHAASVYVLVGLTVVALAWLHRADGRRRSVLHAAGVLLIVELSQGLIGFVQYFTDLPIVLVEFHLLGASVLMACGTWLLLATRERTAADATPVAAAAVASAD